MTFTKTPPTTPGFYAWRRDGDKPITTAVLVENTESWRAGTIPLEHCHMNGGEWCRLVPSEQVTILKEAIEYALPFHYQCWRDKQSAGAPEEPKCRLQGVDTKDYCPHCKIYVVLEQSLRQVAEGTI